MKYSQNYFTETPKTINKSAIENIRFSMDTNSPYKENHLPHIYKVILNDKIKYIGYTQFSIKKRWSEHIRKSKLNTTTQILHNAIRKYGEDAFSVESIMEHEDAEYLRDVMEPKFILEHQTHVKYGLGGYNMTDGGEGNIGCIPSIETRAKISRTKMGKLPSKEAREKMSIAQKGKYVSEETRKKLSASLMGRKISEEWSAKISLAMKGKPSPNKGKSTSKETKQKISLAMKGKPGKPQSLETRLKISKTMKTKNKI